jgi:hypothetical protein
MLLKPPYRQTGVCPPVPPKRSYFPACLANNNEGEGAMCCREIITNGSIFPSQDTVIGRMIGLLLALWFYG